MNAVLVSPKALAQGVSDESEIWLGESQIGSGESETGLGKSERELGESQLELLIFCWMDFVGRFYPCLLTFEVVTKTLPDKLLLLHRHCKTVDQL